MATKMPTIKRGPGPVEPSMETSALAWIGLAAMIVSLFLIPLGLPGVWIMIAILFLGVANGMVSGWIFFLLVLLAEGPTAPSGAPWWEAWLEP